MAHLAIVRSLLCFLIAVVPPLTASQHDRLNRAIDGRDQLDDAFFALLENVQQWNGDVGDAPIRLRPDYAALLADPARYRGDLCRLLGRIQQQTRLPPPNESVWEWFIRGDDRQPVLIYVAGLNSDQAYRDGQLIEIDARFCKRIDAIAMDGRQHSYSAFIGAFPRTINEAAAAPSLPPGQSDHLWIVSIPVGAMFIIFIGLLLYARRGTRQTLIGSRPKMALGTLADRDRLDSEDALPDDPAAALAELKRRAAP